MFGLIWYYVRTEAGNGSPLNNGVFKMCKCNCNSCKFSVERIKALYIDYVNNFVSVEYFAEYYSLTKNQALAVISRGRVLSLAGKYARHSRGHFLNNVQRVVDQKFPNMSTTNKKYFICNHTKKLLAECSA